MKKWLLIISGIVSLTLGIVGIFIPLLPTTPFLLLASACFIRSSDSLYRWLINHRVFGNYIRCYQQHRAICPGTRIFTLVLLWATIGYSIVFAVKIVLVRLLLLLIAVCVSYHLFSLNTMTPEMKESL